MKVWVPEDFGLGDDLPDGVEVEAFPPDGSSGSAEEVKFVVPPLLSPSGTLEMLGDLPALEVIQVTSAGVDWILPHVPSGVTLCDGRGVHDVSVSEWVVGAILAVLKGFPRHRDHQREARWERAPGDDLEGSRVLIVGYGSIGQAVERRLEPFGVDVSRVAHGAREGVHAIEDLSGLLSAADVVVVLLPLTDETKGLFDGSLLGKVRDGALFVNAARGALVDTEALTEELSSGRIRAALDTVEPEPLPEDHPLWSAPGVFITPHVAGDTRKFPERAYRLVAEQISRYAAGEPLLNVVREGY